VDFILALEIKGNFEKIN